MELLVHSAQFAAEAEALRERARRSSALDVDDGFEALLDAADPDARRARQRTEAAAWITYTSGTTGRPKGVTLSHRSIREVAFNLLLELGPVDPGTAGRAHPAALARLGLLRPAVADRRRRALRRARASTPRRC